MTSLPLVMTSSSAKSAIAAGQPVLVMSATSSLGLPPVILSGRSMECNSVDLVQLCYSAEWVQVVLVCFRPCLAVFRPLCLLTFESLVDS